MRRLRLPTTLDQARALDRFLAGRRKRAYRIARIAVRHDDDALDIVQDSMLQLARRYGEASSERMAAVVFSHPAESNSRLPAPAQGPLQVYGVAARGQRRTNGPPIRTKRAGCGPAAGRSNW